MFKDQLQQDVIMVLKFPSNSPVTHVAANTLPHLTIPAVVTVTCSRLFAVNRWNNTVGEQSLEAASRLKVWFIIVECTTPGVREVQKSGAFSKAKGRSLLSRQLESNLMKHGAEKIETVSLTRPEMKIYTLVKMSSVTCVTYHSSSPQKSLHHDHTQSCPPLIMEL